MEFLIKTAFACLALWTILGFALLYVFIYKATHRPQKN